MCISYIKALILVFKLNNTTKQFSHDGVHPCPQDVLMPFLALPTWSVLYITLSVSMLVRYHYLTDNLIETWCDQSDVWPSWQLTQICVQNTVCTRHGSLVFPFSPALHNALQYYRRCTTCIWWKKFAPSSAALFCTLHSCEVAFCTGALVQNHWVQHVARGADPAPY